MCVVSTIEMPLLSDSRAFRMAVFAFLKAAAHADGWMCCANRLVQCLKPFQAIPVTLRFVLLIALFTFWHSQVEAACHNKRTQSACAAAKICSWDREKNQCY